MGLTRLAGTGTGLETPILRTKAYLSIFAKGEASDSGKIRQLSERVVQLPGLNLAWLGPPTFSTPIMDRRINFPEDEADEMRYASPGHLAEGGAVFGRPTRLGVDNELSKTTVLAPGHGRARLG